MGYACPDHVDPADFLQELPTAEGQTYLLESHKDTAPRGTEAFVAVWKKSELYAQMMKEVNDDSDTDIVDVERGQVGSEEAAADSLPNEWPEDLQEPFPGSFWYYFKLTLARHSAIIVRDTAFITTRIVQNIISAVLIGSLFSNLKTENVVGMNGLLYGGMLSSALGSFGMLPIIYYQKLVHYKQSASSFYPTSVFTLCQAIVLMPLQLIEILVFTIIVYWSAGLASDYNGSRFFTFLLIVFVFAVTLSQFYRLIGFTMPNMEAALPASGLVLMLMILFSGYIQPKVLISDGWIWFYWLNPVAWGIKAVTINEYKAPRFDFMTCTDVSCTTQMRFGDFILSQYGNPTNESEIWYSLAILIGEFIVLLIASTWALKYIRWEATPPPPMPLPKEIYAPDAEAIKAAELPFDPVTFAFREIEYSVTLPTKEEKKLLNKVSGYFEPGTMVALMGSSGAGKTTLLDVLADRKTTGTTAGEVFLNGKPKVNSHFRRIMVR